jgi:hypothetical protein
MPRKTRDSANRALLQSLIAQNSEKDDKVSICLFLLSRYGEKRMSLWEQESGAPCQWSISFGSQSGDVLTLVDSENGEWLLDLLLGISGKYGKYGKGGFQSQKLVCGFIATIIKRDGKIIRIDPTSNTPVEFLPEPGLQQDGWQVESEMINDD